MIRCEKCKEKLYGAKKVGEELTCPYCGLKFKYRGRL